MTNRNCCKFATIMKKKIFRAFIPAVLEHHLVCSWLLSKLEESTNIIAIHKLTIFTEEPGKSTHSGTVEDSSQIVLSWTFSHSPETRSSACALHKPKSRIKSFNSSWLNALGKMPDTPPPSESVVSLTISSCRGSSNEYKMGSRADARSKNTIFLEFSL